MIKFEQLCFGSGNNETRNQFPLTIYEQVHLKYCAVLTIQGITIPLSRWYIRSDNLYELYTKSYGMARSFLKIHYFDVAVLLFSQQAGDCQHWHYYSPMVIYK